MLILLKSRLNLSTVIIMGILNAQSVSGEIPPRSNFDFVFENNFEDDQIGDYLFSDYYWDWNNPQGTQRQSEVDILSDGDNYGKYMRGYFPVGTIGPSNGGWSWNTALTGSITELYFSYDIRFRPDFKWVLGGKIPGVTGGNIISGRVPLYDDGFSARMIWAPEGVLDFYVYHHDQTGIYGAVYHWGDFHFSSGQWYNLTIRIVLNSVKNDVGDNNGILEGFVDGKLVVQLTNFRFRNFESIKVDQLYIASFFGGNESIFNSERDEWIDTDNYIAFTYDSDVLNVPRGRETSSWSKTLLHPYHDFLDNDWKMSFHATAVTSSKIDLAWADYPVSVDYILERQVDGSSTFESIATLVYGTKTYTDTDVDPSTEYTYRLQANNSTSNQVIVKTSNPYIPEAPTSLETIKQTKSSVGLKWIDNSENETGFYVYMKSSLDANYQILSTELENSTFYLVSDLAPELIYSFVITAYNSYGESALSNQVTIITEQSELSPLPPSSLEIANRSTHSLTLEWKDNSSNESGFLIKRAEPPDFTFYDYENVDANDTSFIDNTLDASTTYIYTVIAVNNTAQSSESNKVTATTMSFAESKRSRDGLVAYYNFSLDPEFVIRDLSDYDPPLNLFAKDLGALEWTSSSRLKVIDNTIITSQEPAKKIVDACKKTNEITIECWLKYEAPTLLPDARIVSLSSNKEDLGFAIGQSINTTSQEQSYNYFVQLNTESTGSSGLPYFTPKKELKDMNLHQLVYVKDSAGFESIYLDGNQVATSYRPLSFSNWNDSYYLNLANEKSLNEPWLGIYYLVAIYNKALDESTIKNNFEAKPSDNIIKNNLNVEVKIYPNPARTSLYIEIIPEEDFDYSADTHIRLVNLYGQVIYDELLYNPNEPYFKNLKLSGYSKGLYVFQLSSGNKYYTERIVIY